MGGFESSIKSFQIGPKLSTWQISPIEFPKNQHGGEGTVSSWTL